MQPSEQCATRGIVNLFMVLFSFLIKISLEKSSSTAEIRGRMGGTLATDDLSGSFRESLLGVAYIFNSFAELLKLSRSHLYAFRDEEGCSLRTALHSSRLDPEIELLPRVLVDSHHQYLIAGSSTHLGNRRLHVTGQTHHRAVGKVFATCQTDAEVDPVALEGLAQFRV